ncbi:hypothetical protein M0638_26550, partial [Roseomonas sp. NAR14]
MDEWLSRLAQPAFADFHPWRRLRKPAWSGSPSGGHARRRIRTENNELRRTAVPTGLRFAVAGGTRAQARVARRPGARVRGVIRDDSATLPAPVAAAAG